MISVTEARKLLLEHYPEPQTESIELNLAAGRILAKPVSSLVSVPPFDNSAMDGYAFAFKSWNGQPLPLIGESAAGKPWELPLEPGNAVRIFTGAMLPPGADTVVMQEKTQVIDGVLIIQDEKLSLGSNVRKKGSQNQVGALLMNKDTHLTAGVMGFLAGCGVSAVDVYRKPKVSILVTGDEIVSPGQNLKPGQVFECNSFSLIGAMQPLGIRPAVSIVADQPMAIENAIKRELQCCDVLLLTGGVSVGDYDYVVPALDKCSVRQIFHRIKQKPAKPLYAGFKNDQIVFGLPGNPASVLTSFYVYVQPLLFAMMGLKMTESTAIFTSNFKRKSGLTQFLKGIASNNKVEMTEGQESYRMDGFALANCLIEIPEDAESVQAGESVKIIGF